MTGKTDYLAEWRRKVAAGEVKRPKQLDPLEKARKNPRSLRLAINAKCYECACRQRIEVTRCVVTDCPLHPVRPWQRDKAAGEPSVSENGIENSQNFSLDFSGNESFDSL